MSRNRTNFEIAAPKNNNAAEELPTIAPAEGEKVDEANALIAAGLGTPESNGNSAEEKEVEGEAEETQPADDRPLTEDEILEAELMKEAAELAERQAATDAKIAKIRNDRWLAETADAYKVYEDGRKPLSDDVEFAREALADALALLEKYDAENVNPRAPKVEAKVVNVAGTPEVGTGDAAWLASHGGVDFSIRESTKDSGGRLIYKSQWLTALTPNQYAVLKAKTPEQLAGVNGLNRIAIYTPTCASIWVQGHAVHGEIAARKVTLAHFGKTQDVITVAWGTSAQAPTVAAVK